MDECDQRLIRALYPELAESLAGRRSSDARSVADLRADPAGLLGRLDQMMRLPATPTAPGRNGPPTPA